MSSILQKAKKSANQIKARQRAEEKKAIAEGKTFESFKKKVITAVRKTLSELDGQTVKNGVLQFAHEQSDWKIGSVYIKRPDADEYLFSVEWDNWEVGGFYEGQDTTQTSGIKISYFSDRQRCVGNNYDYTYWWDEHIGFTEYSFKESMKRLKEWLSTYLVKVF